MPGLKLSSDRLVEQRALGVMRVVEFGFGARWLAHVSMRVRWASDGGHGAVPARAECPMVLGLYPALWISLLDTDSQITPQLIAVYVYCTRAEGQIH